MSHLTNRADKHCAQIYFCGRLGASLALRALLIPAGLCFVFEVSLECALLGANQRNFYSFYLKKQHINPIGVVFCSIVDLFIK